MENWELTYDTIDRIWDSEKMDNESKVRKLVALKQYGQEVTLTVYKRIVGKFGRHLTEKSWDRLKPFMQLFLKEYGMYHNSYDYPRRWDLLCVKEMDTSYHGYLLVKQMNYVKGYRFFVDSALDTFLLKTTFQVVKQYEQCGKWFQRNSYNRLSVSNEVFSELARVLNLTYILLYKRFSDNDISRLRYEMRGQGYIQEYPEFFQVKNLCALINKEIDKCEPLNIEVVQGLYKTDNYLGRKKVQEIVSQYKSDRNFEEYIVRAREIVQRCGKSSDRDYIYKEVIKPICSKHRQEALQFYFEGLVSTIYFKPTKAIGKALFPTELSRKRFDDIIADYNKQGDAANVEERIASLYDPERKRIVISNAALNDKQDTQKKTAEMLDAILADEEETQAVTISKSETMGCGDEVVDRFRQKGFVMTDEEVNELAAELGMMPSMMIDAVNEKYYETLDDNLIEQDGCQYVMNEEYLNQII